MNELSILLLVSSTIGKGLTVRVSQHPQEDNRQSTSAEYVCCAACWVDGPRQQCCTRNVENSHK
eukprot:3362494-Amphidinium_carterae.1